MRLIVTALALCFTFGVGFSQIQLEPTKPETEKATGITFRAPSGLASPLFVVDEVETTREDIAKMNPQDIESITVLKTVEEVQPYGEKGKNGVILIETKQAALKKSAERKDG